MRNLEEELKKVEWRVVGLAEIHREGEGCTRLENGDLFYYSGGKGDHGGTGFIVSRKYNDQEVIKFESFSTRVTVLTLVVCNCKVALIQVYAPTSQSTEEELELFYADLCNAVDSSKKSGRIFCMGDFNAKVGWRRKERCMGIYGYGKRNERGERLVEFVEGMNYRILNSFFKKNEEDRWTWLAPNGNYMNEIDFILTNKWDCVRDVGVVTVMDIGSDHRAVGVKINWGKKRRFFRGRNKTKQLSSKVLIKKGFEDRLKNKLRDLSTNTKDWDISIMNNLMREVQTEIELESNENIQNCRNLPIYIKRLMEKRRKLKKVGTERIEYRNVCKLVRKELNEWLEKRKIDKIEIAVSTGGKLKDKTSPKSIIIALNNREGKVLREQDRILSRVKEFYEEIYSGTQIRSNQDVETSEWDESQSILKEEVEWAIKDTKEGKAGGIDRITVEMIKAGGETIVEFLTNLYNTCLRNGILPDEWYLARLVLLFKKGDRKELKNYRPLSLLCVEYKMLSKILTKRLDNHLDYFLTPDQAGFRPDFSTIDHMFLLNELTSKSKEYNFGFSCLFIDYEKAFDFVSTDGVINMLKDRLVYPKIISLLKNTFQNSGMIFELEGKEVTINVRRGVKQGDVISPKLFIGVLQKIMNGVEWGKRGIKIEGEFLNRLEFADDVVLIGTNITEIRDMVGLLNEECKKFGMKINGDKCRLMNFGKDEGIKNEMDLEIDGKVIKEEKEFIYLGQLISVEGQWPEICRRCAIGWRAMGRYRFIFKSKVSIDSKRRLWEMVVLPAMIYGCETWVMEARVRNKLRVTVRGMERYIIGKTRRDRVRNTWVRNKTRFKDIVKIVMKRKWKWAGHIVRGKERWTTRVMNWCPREFKRARGRPRDRWDKEMRLVCGGATWRRVAEERREWKRMGEVFREVWLPQE